jgi:dephospho-CoA kinase
MAQVKNNLDARLTLVVGVDGSGKSTFLAGMEREYGCEVLEPSATLAMKKFKKDNNKRLITSDFIDLREGLFLNHNTGFAEEYIRTEATHLASTGSALVTLVSHGLMRAIVEGEDGVDKDDVAEQSLEAFTRLNEPLPDDIVLIHAPDEVIQARIRERQLEGQKEEDFWGFNSPHFLSHYQMTWLNVVERIPSTLGVTALSLDTSILNPDEMIKKYSLAENL